MNNNATFNLGYYNKYYKENSPIKLFLNFNFWVFLFGPCWFFFRKMFGVGIFLSLCYMLFSYALYLSPLTPALLNKSYYFKLIFLLPNTALAYVADWIYMLHVSRWRKLNKTNITYGFKYGVIGFLIFSSFGVFQLYLETKAKDYKARQIDKIMEKDGMLSVEILKSGLIDLNYTDTNGQTLAFQAAKNNLIHQLTYLAQKDVDLEKPVKLGFKPLYAAAVKGHIKSVKCLLDHGAQVDGVSIFKDESNSNTYEQTALFGALSAGNFEVSRLLIEYGANVNFISNHYVSLTPIYAAIVKNDLNAVKLLIENDANVNYIVKLDAQSITTPLVCAIQNTNLEMVKFLINNKADIHYSPNNTTSLALLAAQQANKKEIIDYLIKKGAK